MLILFKSQFILKINTDPTSYINSEVLFVWALTVG